MEDFVFGIAASAAFAVIAPMAMAVMKHVAAYISTRSSKIKNFSIKSAGIEIVLPNRKKIFVQIEMGDSKEDLSKRIIEAVKRENHDNAPSKIGR